MPRGAAESTVAYVNTYCNPIKKQGDFADPFVLRHNGRYYLYATNPDIRCWSSEDLLAWEEEGPTVSAQTFPGLVPFAPEVVYHNGAFYMFTSPSAYGHYVLKSAAPTGPFEKITGNVGHNIDGSVFIDDDGQWYFYWAHDDGIMCCKMPAPGEFGEPVNTGAYLHGWTEGPMVVKEGGLYYMTYTGNHYLSKGYRVHAAVSGHPQGPYRDTEYNPILVHTTGENSGLGHSSTVLGPDLAACYLVYHNMNPDLTRDLNIDAIEMKDGRVQLAGPSRGPQPAPALPLFRADPRREGFVASWDILEGAWEKCGDYFITHGDTFECAYRRPLPKRGAAECNLYGGAARYGVSFGGCTLVFDQDAGAVSLTGAGQAALATAPLPPAYDHSAPHCVLARYGGEAIELSLDGRRLFSARAGGGIEALGFFARGGAMGIGCATVSDAVNESARLCHPLPCRVFAEETICLNVPESGPCTLTVLARSVAGENNALTLLCGEEHVYTPTRITEDCAAYRVMLPQGRQVLTLRFGRGVSGPRQFFFRRFAEPAPQLAASLELSAPVGKRAAGMPEMADGEASLSFTMCDCAPGAQAGLLFRATELALGGEGADEALGINFFIGYCASVTDGWLVLTKHRYDATELARVPVTACSRIRVEAILNDIAVFCGDDAAPALRYHDPEPILWGRAGARATGCTLRDAHLTIQEK